MIAAIVTAPVARAEPLRISVFGDSVLLGAAGAIQSALAPNNVSVDAHENLSLLGALGTLQAARPDIGDVVVLDLGYNDGPDPGVWRGRVDQAMAILAGVPKVIWLGQSNFANGRAEMNAQLVSAMQQYPNLEFVDWNTIVAAHPDAVYGDGVHLTPVGQAAMADVVRQRVDAFVAARVAATSTTLAPATAPTTLAPSTTSAPDVDGGKASATPTSHGHDDGSEDGPWIVAAVAAGVLLLAVTAGVTVARRRVRG